MGTCRIAVHTKLAYDGQSSPFPTSAFDQHLPYITFTDCLASQSDSICFYTYVVLYLCMYPTRNIVHITFMFHAIIIDLHVLQCST